MDQSADQQYERGWWGNCVNTFGEEAKQLTYAHHMGLVNVPDPVTGHWPQYDLQGKSVLDIGGGPASMLLKTINGGRLSVVDPCEYPEWVTDRYTAAGINQYRYPGENFRDGPYLYDECWIYNVLQHVEDPEKCIDTARHHAKVLRIFDWIDIPPTLGHPHMLTKPKLDEWIKTDGATAYSNENGAVGWAYVGVYAL